MSSNKKSSLDKYLQDVYKQFISVKDSDYASSVKVFESVFMQVKEKMKQADSFFNQYLSKTQAAGSVYDGVKVGKLDEFDMDIVIKLPISYEDGANGIILENHIPGFVKMKIGNAFDNLDKQQHWESRHKVTRDWRDGEKYFLQSRFRSWIEGVVENAVKAMDKKVVVEDVTYILTYKKSGPAFTLNVKNASLNFELDVDLVPVIRFLMPRWPEGYRKVADNTTTKDWLVVPKPLKSIGDVNIQNQCWRLAFHDQEREIIKGSKNLKLTIRLLKKLRDSLSMKAIASYYIKTLFLWEVEEQNDPKYWENKLSVLYKDMIQKLYLGIKNKNIPYYWHKDYNLIESLNDNVKNNYVSKLEKVINKLEENDVKETLKFLLTPDELKIYKNTDNYIQLLSESAADNNIVKSLLSCSALPKPEQVVAKAVTSASPDIIGMLQNLISITTRIEEKVDYLQEKVMGLEDKVLLLEQQLKRTDSETAVKMFCTAPVETECSTELNGALINKCTDELTLLDI